MDELDDRGYLIIAVNTPEVDYIDCAIACARSIKIHTPAAKVALLTDKHIETELFDYVLLLDNVDTENPYANDWQ